MNAYTSTRIYARSVTILKGKAHPKGDHSLAISYPDCLEDTAGKTGMSGLQ